MGKHGWEFRRSAWGFHFGGSLGNLDGSARTFWPDFAPEFPCFFGFSFHIETGILADMALAGVPMKTAHICVKSQRRPVFSVGAATLTILLASLHLTSLFAQTSATTSLQPVGRYLFAVETSRAMQARAS